jgi:hypothetical protein
METDVVQIAVDEAAEAVNRQGWWVVLLVVSTRLR